MLSQTLSAIQLLVLSISNSKRNIDHSDGFTAISNFTSVVKVLDTRPQRAYPRLVEVRLELSSLNWSCFKPFRKFVEFWLLLDRDRVWRGSLVEWCRARALVVVILCVGFMQSFWSIRRFRLLLLWIWSHNFFLKGARLLFPTTLTLGVDELDQVVGV